MPEARSRTATRAFSAAKARAMAAPIPRAAPKTATTLPERPNSIALTPSSFPGCALAPGLLVAAADVDHAVTDRRISIRAGRLRSLARVARQFALLLAFA